MPHQGKRSTLSQVRLFRKVLESKRIVVKLVDTLDRDYHCAGRAFGNQVNRLTLTFRDSNCDWNTVWRFGSELKSRHPREHLAPVDSSANSAQQFVQLALAGLRTDSVDGSLHNGERPNLRPRLKHLACLRRHQLANVVELCLNERVQTLRRRRAHGKYAIWYVIAQ